jgi:hypothetical protein
LPRIEEMWAWVSNDQGTNDPIDEGVIGIKTPEGWMPAVGADKARIESLRPYAQLVAFKTGVPVRLLKFSTREEVEVIPGGK